MAILEQLIAELKTDDKTQQVRELCDQIIKEEGPNIKHIQHLPSGPNIFLALEVPGRTTKEVAYLTLERESEELYLTVLYTIPLTQVHNNQASLKRQKVWEIKDNRPQKILTQYAKVNKHLRGE